MIEPTFHPLPPGQPMSRDHMLVLLRTAQTTGALRFGRQAALSWLSFFPGDLPIQLEYAQILTQAGLANDAIPILENVCLADPEYLEAYRLLIKAQEACKQETGLETLGAVYALSGETQEIKSLPLWASPLRESRLSFQHGDVRKAEALIHIALSNGLLTPLMAVTHLHVSVRQVNAANGFPIQVIIDLADHYHKQWPTCLIPLLLLADTLMDRGGAEKAVALLHQAVTCDVTAQTITRLWGTQHHYRSLWPEELAAPIEIAIPAEVAGVLGWNRLSHLSNSSSPHLEVQKPSQPLPKFQDPIQHIQGSELKHHGSPSTAIGMPSESLRSVQDELERVAKRLKKRYLARMDGRFPVYVILTTHRGLEKYCGSKTPAIETALMNLASAIRKNDDWESIVLLADDPVSTGVFGLQPAPYDDPWKIKLILADLDAALGHHGQMIGALLIVGGPEVVPFHCLPNPVDDADTEIPSDNPYATRDENYFVPEWSLGRLPDGGNPDILIKLLGDITTRHLQRTDNIPWYKRFWMRMRNRFSPAYRRTFPGWVYTTAAWLRASLSIFRPISNQHVVSISPPTISNGSLPQCKHKWLIPPAVLVHFNLHGVKDSSDWYGQQDPTNPCGTQDYPVALKPRDIGKSDTLARAPAPQVIFSEACYGADIQGKTVDEVIALKLLESGSQAVVGSTTASYGSVKAPLIAADLLGNAFWKYLKEKMPVGEALRYAKIQMAREMHRRQSYLDGEDQKTLISFVLYGDPLAYPTDHSIKPRTILRTVNVPNETNTIISKNVSIWNIPGSELTSVRSDKGSSPHPEIQAETIEQVKMIVEQYLPGMTDANFTFGFEQVEINEQSGASSKVIHKGQSEQILHRSVVTLSKQIQGVNKIHNHYARLTLDDSGNIIKMAVSR